MPSTIKLLFFIFFLINTGCSGEKTDKALLKKDREKLEKSLNSEQIFLYKCIKISLRSSIPQNTNSPELQKFKSNTETINQLLLNNPGEPSFTDYLKIYRSYSQMRQFVKDTDEDVFPTLTESFSVSESLKKGEKVDLGKLVLLQGEEKTKTQNAEHAGLSIFVLWTRDLGKDVALYECYKTNTDLLPDDETKALLQFYRGFLFFYESLPYLSEHESTKTIDWLNKNQNIDLPLTRLIFMQDSPMDNRKTCLAFLSLNHLFRGVNRLKMDRKIDQKRALEDFEIFIDNSRKSGINNELTWAIEAFLYIKKEEGEKAVEALTRLKGSPLLPDSDRKSVEETITYLQTRKKGEWSNVLFDKIFLGKIVSRYMFSVLQNVDWKKILEDRKIPYTKEIFNLLDRMKTLTDNLDKYTRTDNLKQTTEEVQNKGNTLFQKVKDLLK